MQLVVFADDWGRHPSSMQHLVRHLSPEGYDILWVNTLGTRRPRLTREDFTRIAARLRQWFGRSRDVASPTCPPHLTVISPRMYPGFRRPWQRRLNAKLLARQINLALLRRSPASRCVAITTLPIAADLVGQLLVDRWVYNCVDDFAAWPGLDAEVMRAMERELVQQVDAVAAASPVLADRMRELGYSKPVRIISHGVDIEKWQYTSRQAGPEERAVASNEGPDSIGHEPPIRTFAARSSPLRSGLDAQFARPSALFWGLLDRRLDIDWCIALGKALQKRGGELVLVGPMQDADERLHQVGITILPGVEYDRLPALAAKADVLVMPYADLPVTRAMQPLKLKEYLATGKPVVVRDLPATRPWADACDVLADVDGFVDRVLQRCQGPLPTPQREARRRLAGESWSAKAAQLEQLIQGDAVTVSHCQEVAA